MEKISGILPSSARVTNVDLREAPPVRPSTPSFRPSRSFFEPAASWKIKEMSNASVADEVSDGFFTNYNNKMEVGVPAPLFTPEPEPEVDFTPKVSLPLSGSLEPYGAVIYGEDPNAANASEESGQNLDVYA